LKILVPFGTRPEILKLASIVRTLKERGFEVITVATGSTTTARSPTPSTSS
jgi:UDP-N-acetylglucosamine 2-epimerase